MKRNREIRAAARQAMNGHWGWAILVCLVYGVIVAITQAPNSIGSVLRLGMSSRGMAAAAAAAGISILGSMFTLFVGLFFTNPLSVGFNNSIKAY